MPDLTGQNIGRYHLVKKLGAGGMATVYMAFDTRLERKVAIKVIRRDAFPVEQLEKVSRRFDREAKMLAQLTHPNIVGIIDYGDFGGSPYLVMEYLPGGTLKQRLGKPMPYRTALQLLMPIALALDYVHQKGFVHRDIKPANILFTEGGQPMLTDFGIAKILEENAGGTLTGTAVGMGTPEYMAPEQGMGRDIDGRADVYALGVVLYELVTGHKPYTADTPMAVIFKHLTEPLPRLKESVPDLPDAVELIILRAMAKRPGDRYQSMREFAAGMLEVLNKGSRSTEEVADSLRTSYSKELPINEDKTAEAPFSKNPKTALLPHKDQPNHSPSLERTAVSPVAVAKMESQGSSGEVQKLIVKNDLEETCLPQKKAASVWAKLAKKPWLMWVLATVAVVLLISPFIFPIQIPAKISFQSSSLSPVIATSIDPTAKASSLPVPTAIATEVTIEPSSTPLPTEILTEATIEPSSTPAPTATANHNQLKISSPDNDLIMILGDGLLNQIIYSPDGSRLAAATSVGAFLYDADTLEKIQFIDTGNYVNSVAFSPDGRRLASGSSDSTIKLWDAQSGALLQTLEGHGYGVSSVVFSPDGRTLASGSYDKTIKLWDVQSGALLHTLEGHRAGVLSVTFSPDGSTLASGSDDGIICLWDAAGGQLRKILREHTTPVFSVVFSPDGRTLASGSAAGTILLWNAGTGQWQSTLRVSGTSVESIVFSPDGRTLAASAGRQLQLWDIASGQQKNLLYDWGNSIAFSPDGSVLAIGGWGVDIHLYDAQSGALLQTLQRYSSGKISVAFSKDGCALASGSTGNAIALWDAQSGALLQTLEGHRADVLSVTFSPDGRRLASGSSDSTIKLWDAQSGALLQTLEGHGGSVNSVAFSPDGRMLASGSADKTIKLWDAQSGALLQTLEGHGIYVTSVAFSPDGSTLASGSADNTIKLWDAQSGALLQTLEGHSGTVTSVAFSPDGSTLASGSADNTIKLWDAQSGALLQTLEGHSLSVTSVAFSPDGHTLASGSDNNTIKLWDAESGALVRTLEGHTSNVNSVAFSPDGKKLASGSSDGTIRIWNIAEGH